MSKKEKVIITLSVFCMVLTVLVGYTYSLWTVSKTQTGMNVIGSNCLNIIFTEADDIELTNTYPMLDSEGLQTQPYTFTIENTCDTYANYQINLETFDVASGKTRMPDNYIKANLKLGNGTKISDVLNSDIEVEPTIEGATNAYKLGVGTLKGKATKTYNLRLWMDERITQDDENATNSSFKGKVSIQFTAALDPFAGAGTLKRAPTSSPTEFWAYRDNITEVEFQNKMEPIVDAIESWDVSSTNDGSVMAYMINQGTEETPEYKVYIQGRNGVRANPNSSHLFEEFKKLKEIKGLEYFDTSNVTDMYGMFFDCSKLEKLDISNFDTSNVKRTIQMFYSCQSLTELDLSSFDTSNVTDMGGMFAKCIKLNSLDVSSFDTSNVTNFNNGTEGLFYECRSLIELDLSNFDVSKVTNFGGSGFNYGIFSYCKNLKKLNLNGWNSANVKIMTNMFRDCSSLEELDLSSFDTSNVTDMSGMFAGCSKLENLDVSNWDTSNVTNMEEMFSQCSKLTNFDVSHFDTSNVTDMSGMFAGCSKLETLDLNNFDTSKVTDMGGMFAGCSKLETLDLNNFDTSKVTDMGGMFYNCSSLISLDITNFDTSNVTTMGSAYSSINSAYGSGMFERCSKLSYLDLSNFDTSNVIVMGKMFYDIGTSINQVDIVIGNGFDTSNVTDMSGMFEGISSSNTKINFDFSKLNFMNVKKAYRMFFDNKNINGVLNFNGIDVVFNNIFNNAATVSGIQLTVNYTSQNEELVDAMIATKSVNSNVVKGEMLDAATAQLHSISAPSTVTLNKTSAYKNNLITLVPVQSNKLVKSFKVNETLVEGNSFRMLNENVIITDVEIVDGAIVESEHSPYPNRINNEVYYENTFDGATSITVELTYQTESTNYDWVYLYTSSTDIYQNKKYGGTTLNTETITIDGDYLKITFRTDYTGNNYYGFKAVITPNY